MSKAGAWTERAEELTDQLKELSSATAMLFGSAWRARVDLDALGGLAGATISLGQRPSVLQPQERGEALPSDRELRERAEDLEGDAGDLFRAGNQLGVDATQAWHRACRDLQAAQKAMKDAKTAKDRGAAEHAAADANARIADCEVAIEILEELVSRLSYAIGCFTRVPDELHTTYAAAYALLDQGGVLPHDGDFLTPNPEASAGAR